MSAYQRIVRIGLLLNTLAAVRAVQFYAVCPDGCRRRSA